MAVRSLIVVGASAGGVGALRSLAASLPGDLPAAVAVVLHIGRHRSELATILDRAGPLAAAEARNDEPLVEGRIYVAGPDCHLLVAGERLHLQRGPRENFARPAIDPLFRTAAESFGPRAIGVILSGRLNDGTVGLYEIKRRGGLAVVQSPEDAQYPEMPASALRHVAVDHRVALAEIPPLLARLAAKLAAPTSIPRPAEEVIDMTANYVLERPTALTCPECGGAMDGKDIGTLQQYRCHIGHAYTAEAMASAHLDRMEAGMEKALRLLNERIEICRRMAERPEVPDEKMKAAWFGAMEQAEQRADAMGELLSAGWLAPEE
ncbi:MAG TPA: chemotaxis protein CheB [Gammaproteobacteria bacterium]|nr:chemotaxis protein CheB [Gammaproteobacteria bacterium]